MYYKLNYTENADRHVLNYLLKRNALSYKLSIAMEEQVRGSTALRTICCG